MGSPMIWRARLGPRAEDVLQESFSQHFLRRPGGDDPSLPQDDQLVTEHGGMVEVVEGDDAGDREAGDKAHQPDLVLDVEVVGRFVEEQFLGGLSQRPCNVGALLFAAERLCQRSLRFSDIPTRSRA